MSDPNTSTALVTSASAAIATIDPRAAVSMSNLDEVWKLAGACAAINLCGAKSAEDAYIRIVFGMELGMTAMQAMRSVYLVDGRPGLYAEMIVAQCLSKPTVCEYVDVVESTAKVATYRAKRVGRPEVVMSYTIEQAQAAQLTTKKNWVANPSAMLRARASSSICRAVFPDLVNGIYTPDENEEFAANAYVEPKQQVVVVQQAGKPAAATTPAIDGTREAPKATNGRRQPAPASAAPATDTAKPADATPQAAAVPATTTTNGVGPTQANDDLVLSKLRRAIGAAEKMPDAAAGLTRLDAIFEHSKVERASLSEVAAEKSTALFADARAKIQAAPASAPAVAS